MLKGLTRGKIIGFIIIIVLPVLLITLAGCGLSLKFKQPENNAFLTQGYRILFGGDFSFGDTYEEGRKTNERYGYDYFFNNIKPLLTSADFAMINLETPVAAVDIRPYMKLKKWVHRGEPDVYPAYLKKYQIDAVSLANNHTMDCGAEGLLETLETLGSQSILCVGAGKNANDAARPLIKDIVIGNQKMTLAVFAAYEDRRGISLRPNSIFASTNNPGVNLLSSKDIADGIKAFKNKNDNSFVVVFPHWGENYAWTSQSQNHLAEELIDAGADIIIGHGAHMLQEIGKYKDRWIIYSLGNFVFNTPGRYEKENAWPYSAIAILSFVPENDKLNACIRLYPMLTDNLVTNYQTRPVDEKEFEQIIELFKEKNKMLSDLPENLVQGRDKFGFYLETCVF